MPKKSGIVYLFAGIALIFSALSLFLYKMCIRDSYYTVPVAPGQFTEILFDAVTFAFEIGNEYQGCTANIIIAAQAVQASNNGETVMDAKGWPES